MQWSLGKDELDKRFMTMPEAQGLRLFSSGVSGIGQWTGRKAREMAKQMLCAVAGSVDNEEAELARIGIEFMSYAELPTMRESDVAEMERIADGISRPEMDYGRRGVRRGTQNLHIHYAKKPWQALNKVRPEKQMMVYIQRQEAIRIHRSYMNSYCGIAVKDADAGEGADVELEQREYAKGDLEQEGGVQTIEDPASVLPCRQPRPSQVWYPNPRMTIAKNPTHDKVPCRTVINEYGAKDFIELLTKLLADQFDTPAYKSLLLENHQYAVWHRLYLKHPRPPFAIGWPHTDIIRANPPPCNVAGTCIGLGTYDVVLVLDKPGAGGIHRYRAAAFESSLNCLPPTSEAYTTDTWRT
ncbi:Zn-finger protein [Rhizoctonia solani]|uniref:Zn-finger protein n=1 Tax=Rhizoctonia solani TaxID=456999 RepID=A0A8H7M208_9AGAM|nr:Zn-finger protein [Rhizoctonia solani]